MISTERDFGLDKCIRGVNKCIKREKIATCHHDVERILRGSGVY